MEDIVQPIIAKLYQGQGGAPPGGEEEEEDYDKDELWAVINIVKNQTSKFHEAPPTHPSRNYLLLSMTSSAGPVFTGGWQYL